MNIRWTPEAAANLQAICRYIAEDSREAALRTAARIIGRLEQLREFPHSGRIGREKGTRELVLAPLPYIAAYRISRSSVEILSIWHGAQNR